MRRVAGKKIKGRGGGIKSKAAQLFTPLKVKYPYLREREVTAVMEKYVLKHTHFLNDLRVLRQN